MVAETEKEETFSPTDTVKDDYVVNRSRTVSRKGSMSVKILVVYDNEGSDSGSQFASTTSRSFTVTRKHQIEKVQEDLENERFETENMRD